MIKIYKWEAIISVIIWIFLISIIILWVINVLSNNYYIETDFVRNNKIFFLRNNTSNILRWMDTSSIAEGEIFYILKDKDSSQFIAFTWSIWEKYKYINEFWDNIENTWSYLDPLYSRVIYNQKNDSTNLIKNQIMKVWIKELIRK